MSSVPASTGSVSARLPRLDTRPAGWAVSPELVAYPVAVEAMERRAAAIADHEAGELVWLLEHPPLYTAGVSAKPGDLLQPDRFPVFQTGRGGQYTYHGPGQRVAYVMLDLRTRGRDVRAFVSSLEAWLIAALARFDVAGGARDERVGVWVETRGPGGAVLENKIAAIGVRLRRWVSFHGVSLNVAPNLAHFEGIVPCGIADHGVTSLAELGFHAPMGVVDEALRAAFEEIFGPVTPETAPA
ncbi:MAG: lipB [Caulobacteraceae bacterium]|nr:lipB [Caulobacteraceae bacterium]